MAAFGHLDLRADGVAYRVTRGGDGPAVVLLHGFTGSAASWGPWRDDLARSRDVISVDLLGHGGSDAPSDPNRYAAIRQVNDLADLLDQLGIRSAAVVGYSMGARLALAFAATYPARVNLLMLESGSPGIADEASRAERRARDELLALRIEKHGIPAFVDEWERLPLFASQENLPEADRRRLREQRLENRVAGLAGSLRGFGQGSQPALHGALHEVSSPVLLMAGSEDEKYVRLAREMAHVFPDASVEIIEGAGHTPHLEQPERFRRVTAAFLARGRARPED